MVSFDPHPTLLVIAELTLIVTAIAVFYGPLPVAEAVEELTLVMVAVSPKILTLPVGLVPLESPDEQVTVIEPLGSMAILVEVHKLPFVTVAFLIGEDSKA
jgi:hypothetical protein